MPKVTELRTGTARKDLGEFRIKKFNLFDDKDMGGYAALRSKSNDASSGIKIELIKEYSRKTTVKEGDGEDLVVVTTEDIYLVVHYWFKEPKGSKGEKDDFEDAQKTWSDEKVAG